MIDQKRLTDFFVQLCRLNTPPREEGPVADLLQARLEDLGLACLRDEAHRATGGSTGNLIATLEATCAAPPVFFSAHMDTVEPNPDVVIVQEGGVIRTDGTSILGADDKCGIAAIVEAVTSIVEEGRDHGVIQLVFSVCEEVGLLGAANLDRSMLKAEMGFVLDTGAPVGSIVYTAPTQNNLNATIRGRAAHAGFEPEKGVSAIQVAARAIEHMKLGRIDEETTANVGVIHGGAATNVVCPEVTLRAEARSRDPRKLDYQTQQMLEALHEAAADFGAELDVEISRAYTGYRLPPDGRVIQVARLAADAIGLPIHMRAAGGGSDANVYNNSGLQCCVLGTAMRQIHTHQEHVLEEDLVRSAQWVVSIVQVLASQAA
ncbi:MAG: M20/M25/M40 family metallo-hydrolase [Chthonomonadales bacterium]